MTELDKSIASYKQQLQTILDNGGTKQDKIYREIAFKLSLSEKVKAQSIKHQKSQVIASSMMDMQEALNNARYNHQTEQLKAIKEQIGAKVRELNDNEIQRTEI